MKETQREIKEVSASMKSFRERAGKAKELLFKLVMARCSVVTAIRAITPHVWKESLLFADLCLFV